MRSAPAIAFVALFGAAGCSFGCPSHADTARIELKSIRDALELYRIKTNDYPRNLRELTEGWERPFLYSELKLDPWDRDYLLLRPNCVVSRGSDGLLGTEDDISTNDCSPELINQHVLLDAGMDGEVGRDDVYGQKIRFIHSGNVLLAWSYGQDGKPDTQDDQVARISAAAVRRD